MCDFMSAQNHVRRMALHARRPPRPARRMVVSLQTCAWSVVHTHLQAWSSMFKVVALDVRKTSVLRCVQVMRTIAKWWRADKPRFRAAAGLRGEAPEGPATAVRAMQCMWSRFGDRPWGRLRRNDDIRRLVALWP